MKTTTIQQNDFKKVDLEKAMIYKTTKVNEIESISIETNTNSSSEDYNENKEKYFDNNLLKQAIIEANGKLKPMKTGFEFTYHDEVNRVSIKVINKETNEVIKEIPPEDAFKALEKVLELTGMLIDEKL